MSAASVTSITLLGIATLTLCLTWVQISLGGPFGAAPPWVAALAAPAGALLDWLGSTPLEDSGSSQLNRLASWHTLWIPACLLYAGSVWLVLRGRLRDRPFEIDLVLAFAIAFRLVLVTSPPLLETDPNRYLWDGAVVVHGIDPYRYSPLEVLEYRHGIVPAGSPGDRSELAALARLSMDPSVSGAFQGINHPAIPTVYPPVAQLVFAAAAALRPGDVRVLKLILLVFELGVIASMLRLLDRLRRPRTWVLLYAWCPLMLKEYACSGHYDPLATFFLMASMLSLLAGHPVRAGVLGGLAVGSKIYPAVVLFVLARRLGIRGIVAAAGTTALVHAPLLAGGTRDLDGLLTFATVWTGNASIFALVQGALGSPLLARLFCGTVGMVACVLLLRVDEKDDEQVWRKVTAAVALVFLLSPVQNPWYLGWVLPWAALGGRVSWCVLSMTSGAYYAYFTQLAWYRLLPGGFSIDLRWIEYSPFFGILAAESDKKHDL